MNQYTRILMYHSICTPPKEAGAPLYCVSRENIRKQMGYLGTVPFGDSPQITFDDGDITNYTQALPVLKEFKLKAFFFILAGRIGTEGYMTWEQVRELKDSGMTIGSHCMTHRILSGLPDDELDRELCYSKKMIEDDIGMKVAYISIPRGFYDRRVINRAREAGYEAVYTSDPQDNDGYCFGRIPVMASWDLAKFERVVERGLPPGDCVKSAVRRSAIRMLGVNRYERIRTGLAGMGRRTTKRSKITSIRG